MQYVFRGQHKRAAVALRSALLYHFVRAPLPSVLKQTNKQMAKSLNAGCRTEERTCQVISAPPCITNEPLYVHKLRITTAVYVSLWISKSRLLLHSYTRRTARTPKAYTITCLQTATTCNCQIESHTVYTILYSTKSYRNERKYFEYLLRCAYITTRRHTECRQSGTQNKIHLPLRC